MYKLYWLILVIIILFVNEIGDVMRRAIFFSIVFAISAVLSLSAQAKYEDVTGLWKTFDDSTGEQKSTAEIYIEDGKLFGKLVKVRDETAVCYACDEDDSRYNKKVLGMTFITDMKLNSDGVWADGEILDPENGKTYDCEIWLDGDALKVRGYIGFFFRTQQWLR
jgi:uncharacterized protein (DUF2147 family)